MYAPDGSTYDVALPCQAQKMWALADGLLIQRFADRIGAEGARAGGWDSEEEEMVEVPSLFSLAHPLDELKPVALSSHSTGKKCH